MKPMPSALMVRRVLHRLRYGIAQWPHFLSSPGRILQGGPGAAEIFHPMTYADGLSVITKTESSPRLPAVSNAQWNHPFS